MINYYLIFGASVLCWCYCLIWLSLGPHLRSKYSVASIMTKRVVPSDMLLQSGTYITRKLSEKGSDGFWDLYAVVMHKYTDILTLSALPIDLFSFSSKRSRYRMHNNNESKIYFNMESSSVSSSIMMHLWKNIRGISIQ